jgi:hypothetical protein
MRVGGADAEAEPVAGEDADRLGGGDGVDQVGHEVDVAAGGEGDVIVEAPGAAGELVEGSLEVGDELLVEEGEAFGVVAGQGVLVDGGDGVAVGADAGGVADREQGAEGLDVVGRDGAGQEVSRYNRLRRSSREA